MPMTENGYQAPKPGYDENGKWIGNYNGTQVNAVEANTNVTNQIPVNPNKDANNLYIQNAANSAGMSLAGTQDQQMGAAQGLNFGQLLYGQNISSVGKEASAYSQDLKDRMNTNSAQADIYRQTGNQRIAKSAGKLGMAGSSMGGAQEQLYQNSQMAASGQNQSYKDSATAAVGRNITAKQQGMAGQYMAGMGIGNASTPGAVGNYSSGSVICTELYFQGKITKKEWERSAIYGLKIGKYKYIGYLTIAKPIVELMKKSDKLSNLFIGWAKSIAAHKPNLLTRALMPICWVVGYVRETKKEKTIRVIAR
jgi:hypothetical protein